MAPRTHEIFRELGNPQRFAVLVEVALGGSVTHAALRSATGLPKAAVSKRLTELEALGLAIRPGTNRGGWEPTFPEETRAFLAGAADLMAVLAEAEAAAEKQLSERARRSGP